MSEDGRGETKQDVIDDVSRLLSIGPFQVGKGSTEPAEFFIEVAKSLKIELAGNRSKPEIARLIVETAGLKWGVECDSRGSVSGGGSTVTSHGLKVVRQAVVSLNKTSIAEVKHSINVRPRTGSLKLFKNLTFKAWYALGEFIDNSITSSILNAEALRELFGDDYKLIVRISFDENRNELVIDDNAAGISINDLGRALQTSEPPPNTSRGLSLHGVGMKAAGFWWGERITIETHPLGSTDAWAVAMDLVELDKNESDEVAVYKIAHRGVPGTRLSIEGLWNGVPKGRTLGAIRAFLPSIYRSFISADDSSKNENLDAMPGLELYLNDKLLEYVEPKLLVEKFWPTTSGPIDGASPIEWRSDIEVELNDGKKIHGWVGILETMSRDTAGFTLDYRGKSIAGISAQSEEDAAGISLERGAYKPRRIFGQPGLYADQSIVGSFDLSAFGKSITTDSVTWTAEQEEEFVEAVYRVMRNPEKDYIAQASNLRRRKITEKEIESQSSTLEREATNLTNSLNQSGISHDDPTKVGTEGSVEQTIGDFDANSTESDDIDIRTYAIYDAEGHVHEISLKCLNNSYSPFLEIDENQNFGSRVTVNFGHQSIADFSPIEGRIRSLLIRFVLSLGSAEIFLDGTTTERGKLRRKLNQVLDARGRLGQERNENL